MLHISGLASLDGTLNLFSLGGFTAFAGQTFNIMSFASMTGAFSSVNGTDLGDGLFFSVLYHGTDVQLLVNSASEAAPEPGTWLMLAGGCLVLVLSRRKMGRA